MITFAMHRFCYLLLFFIRFESVIIYQLDFVPILLTLLYKEVRSNNFVLVFYALSHVLFELCLEKFGVSEIIELVRMEGTGIMQFLHKEQFETFRTSCKRCYL